jgi:predicted RNA-binding protein
MEYKTYLEVDEDKIEPTEALEKIREIEGVNIQRSI